MAEKLSDVDKLAANITKLIRRSKCDRHEVVAALIAVAAGHAVVGRTHEDCAAFENHAHTAYHSAIDAVTARVRQKGEPLAN